MTRSTVNPWLTRLAVLTAFAALGLICLGGLVTSHGAGMSVPDWPTTYGYNMFFFPISKWVGGIFYEHTHRLAASLVGLLTLVLAVWLSVRESRPWVRWLGWFAVGLVIFQGVLGGLRVTALKDEIGIFHAALAQLFLVLLVVIALASTQTWQRMRPQSGRKQNGLCMLWQVTTALIFLQLVLGACMRHQHAGLAIPDFPKAYGRWWPDLSPEAVLSYNQRRSEVTALNGITKVQILMQLAHRLMALAILAMVVWTARTAARALGQGHALAKGSLVWVGLIVIQALLGAATIWTNKSADVATAHVAVGALSLVCGTILVMAGSRLIAASNRSVAMEPAPCEVPV